MSRKDKAAAAAYAREWRKRPENKAKVAVWMKNWNSRPENKEKRKAYQKKCDEKVPEKRKEMFRRYREKPENRTKWSLWGRKSKYGLTQEQIEHFDKQQTCECCGEPFDKSVNKHVDHDHKTGQFRGVLCRGCNLAEGYLKGDFRRAVLLAEYMLRVSI